MGVDMMLSRVLVPWESGENLFRALRQKVSLVTPNSWISDRGSGRGQSLVCSSLLIVHGFAGRLAGESLGDPSVSLLPRDKQRHVLACMRNANTAQRAGARSNLMHRSVADGFNGLGATHVFLKP